jgi:periplasmic protein CpxP/Spy
MGNFSKTKVLIFIIIVLFLANLAMLGYFLGVEKPPKRGERDTRGPNVMNTVLQEKVGFTAEQMKRVAELRKQHWNNMRQLFEESRKTKIDFYKNLSQMEVSDSLLKTAASRIGKTQEAIDLQTFRNFRDVRALCTPEQLPRYDSLVPATINKMWFPARKGNGNKKDSDKNKH